MKLLIAWNLVVFILFGIDKFCAKYEMYRISEKMLLSGAFFGGGFGALFGMYVFRHKTKKTLFRFLVPLFCVLQVVILFILVKRFV